MIFRDCWGQDPGMANSQPGLHAPREISEEAAEVSPALRSSEAAAE